VIAMSDEQAGKTSDPRGEALLEELTRNMLKPTDLPEGYQLEGPAEPGADADVPGVLGGSGITIISEDEDEPGNRLSEDPPEGL
jgi:hypothetical protein